MQVSQAAGHRIHLLTAQAPQSLLPDSAIPVFTIPDISSYEHETARNSVGQLSHVLNQVNPDIVHIHDLNNPYVIRYCGGSYPTIKTTLNADAYCGGTDKYLYTSGKECHFLLGFGCLPIAYYQNCMSRHPKRSLEIISIKKKSIQALSKIERVVVPSNRSKEILIREGVQPKKITVIPLFSFQSNSPQLPYPNEKKPKILFLGRLRPYKGVSYLLKALQKIKTPCELLIVGEGEERVKLEMLTQKLNLIDRVQFLGNQPHEKMNSYLDACSLLVVPSIYPDSFPTVGLEAMARARPVVGFSVGGIPEWLADSKTGFLVRTQNVQSLAEKIEFLLTHQDIAEKMGIEGKHRSDEYYTEKPHMRLIEQLYAETCESFLKLQTSAP